MPEQQEQFIAPDPLPQAQAGQGTEDFIAPDPDPSAKDPLTEPSSEPLEDLVHSATAAYRQLTPADAPGRIPELDPRGWLGLPKDTGGLSLTQEAKQHLQNFISSIKGAAAGSAQGPPPAARPPSLPPGMLVPGNINLSGRPTIQNDDGSHSTEFSTSFGDEHGREVLVPTIVDGKFLTPDGKKPPEGFRDASGKYHPTPQESTMWEQARQHYKDTGEHMGIFDSPKSADAYALQAHNRRMDETKPTYVVEPGQVQKEQAPSPTAAAAPPGEDPIVTQAVQAAADKYPNISQAQIRAVMEQESGRKVSIRDGSSGEIGPMQIMPSTGQFYKAKDLRDPMENIDIGAHYLSDLMTQFGGNFDYAAGRYNDAQVVKGKPIPNQSYVDSVNKHLQRFQQFEARGQPAAKAAEAAPPPPPGFVEVPGTNDLTALRKIPAVQGVERAARIIGGMAEPLLKSTAPYIFWNMYKKATGQPNNLKDIPPNAIKAFVEVMLAGPGEIPEMPELPQPVPKQLPMPVTEGEYMPPESAGELPAGQYEQPGTIQGQLPAGQYEQPPVRRPALPPGQYEQPPGFEPKQLPQRASAIRLPAEMPRPPVITTTPSEPLPPLATREPTVEPWRPGQAARPKEAEAPPAKGKAPKKAATKQATAKGTTETEAPRTVEGTEGANKGKRFQMKGGKWVDPRTGEELKETPEVLKKDYVFKTRRR